MFTVNTDQSFYAVFLCVPLRPLRFIELGSRILTFNRENNISQPKNPKKFGGLSRDYRSLSQDEGRELRIIKNRQFLALETYPQNKEALRMPFSPYSVEVFFYRLGMGFTG